MAVRVPSVTVQVSPTLTISERKAVSFLLLLEFSFSKDHWHEEGFRHVDLCLRRLIEVLEIVGRSAAQSAVAHKSQIAGQL